MAATSENQLSEAVLKVANSALDGIAIFKKCYAEIPKILVLNKEVLAPSTTRNGEPIWHQRVRNIQSHHEAKKNFIDRGLLEHIPDVGYKITKEGIAYLGK